MNHILNHTILSEKLHCKKCEWSGYGDQAMLQDLFLTDALEIYCPCCDHYFGFINTSQEE